MERKLSITDKRKLQAKIKTSLSWRIGKRPVWVERTQQGIYLYILGKGV